MDHPAFGAGGIGELVGGIDAALFAIKTQAIGRALGGEPVVEGAVGKGGHVGALAACRQGDAGGAGNLGGKDRRNGNPTQMTAHGGLGGAGRQAAPGAHHRRQQTLINLRQPGRRGPRRIIARREFRQNPLHGQVRLSGRKAAQCCVKIGLPDQLSCPVRHRALLPLRPSRGRHPRLVHPFFGAARLPPPEAGLIPAVVQPGKAARDPVSVPPAPKPRSSKPKGHRSPPPLRRNAGRLSGFGQRAAGAGAGRGSHHGPARRLLYRPQRQPRG